MATGLLHTLGGGERRFLSLMITIIATLYVLFDVKFSRERLKINMNQNKPLVLIL